MRETTTSSHRFAPCLRRGFAALLLGATALMLTGCDQAGTGATAGVTPAGSTTPAPSGTTAGPASTTPTPSASVTPTGTPTGTGGPKLSFTNLVHDFGTISDTRKYDASFAFTNTGGADLLIRDVKAACGCTVPTLAKQRYAPGESGQIDIVFDPKGKSGITPKYITVLSNDTQGGEVRLELKSFIKPLVDVVRMFQLGSLPLGQPHTATIDLHYDDPTLDIRNVRMINNDHIHPSLIESGVEDYTANGEPRYRARIQLDVDEDIDWGTIFATRVNFTAYGKPEPNAQPINKTYDVFVMGQVFGEIQASVSIISMGQIKPGQSYSRSIELTRANGPFVVTSATVTESSLPGIQITVEPVGLKQRITVSGNVGSFTGNFRGIISVKTDVPGEEDLKIRFSGLVK